MTIEEKSLPESFNEIHVALPTEQLHRGRSFLIFQRQNGYQQREFRFDRLDESLTPLSLSGIYFLFFTFLGTGRESQISLKTHIVHKKKKKKKNAHRVACVMHNRLSTLTLQLTTFPLVMSSVCGSVQLAYCQLGGWACCGSGPYSYIFVLLPNFNISILPSSVKKKLHFKHP